MNTVQTKNSFHGSLIRNNESKLNKESKLNNNELNVTNKELTSKFRHLIRGNSILGFEFLACLTKIPAYLVRIWHKLPNEWRTADVFHSRTQARLTSSVKAGKLIYWCHFTHTKMHILFNSFIILVSWKTTSKWSKTILNFLLIYFWKASNMYWIGNICWPLLLETNMDA